MTTHAAEARPAATVILVREDRGLEVLMVERVTRGFFGGLMVFPGGALEACDRADAALEAVGGNSSDQPSRAAALRELAEETGIALTTRGPRRAPDARGESLYKAVRDAGMILDGEALTLVSQWVTPTSAPRRYDTRFYLGEISGDPIIHLDAGELVSWTWTSPHHALAQHAAGSWAMFTPTTSHLRWLLEHPGVREARDSASGANGRLHDEPLVLEDGSIIPIGLPGAGE